MLGNKREWVRGERVVRMSNDTSDLKAESTLRSLILKVEPPHHYVHVTMVTNG